MNGSGGRGPLIDALLDLSERQGAPRPDFRPVFPREKAYEIIDRALDLYECREGSAASIYAAVALNDAIGFKPTPQS